MLLSIIRPGNLITVCYLFVNYCVFCSSMLTMVLPLSVGIHGYLRLTGIARLV